MLRGLLVLVFLLIVGCGVEAAVSESAESEPSIPAFRATLIAVEVAGSTATVEAAAAVSPDLRSCLAVFAWFALRHAHSLSTISSRTEPPYMLPKNYNRALIYPPDEPFNALEEYCFSELDQGLLTDLTRRTQFDWTELSD